MITIIRLLIRAEIEASDSEEKEEGTTNDVDHALADLIGDELTGEDGEGGADHVADDTTDTDTVCILGGGEGDDADLRTVSPFGEEGHGEALDEDGREDVVEEGRLLGGFLDEGLGFEIDFFFFNLADLQFFFDFSHFINNTAFLLAVGGDEKVEAEDDEEDTGRNVGDFLGHEHGESHAEEDGEDGHDDEGGGGRGKDEGAGVLHGHDGGDEEGLVANLGNQNHGKGRNEGGDERGIFLFL